MRTLTERRNPISKSLLITVLVLLTASTADAEVTRMSEVAGWTLYLETDESDPDFVPSCFISAEYEEDTSLRFGFLSWSDSINAYIVVSNRDWQSIEDGKSYEIEVEFGETGAWNADASGTNIDGRPGLMILLGSDNLADFMTEFMEQHYVVIRYEGKEIERMGLEGTYKGGELLLECQQYMEQKASDPFSKGLNS